jgi:hypothetical protein
MSDSQVPHDTAQSVPLMEEPDAPLERMLIEAFLQKRGYTLHCASVPLRRICDVPEDEAKRLMTAASAYASAKLAEVETRAHFIDEVHGASPTHKS